MLQLFAFACLLSAAAAQPYYYCNSSRVGVIRDRDFYLVTRRPGGGSSYPPGLDCVFTAESETAAFFVEIKVFQVTSPTSLTISSGYRILFSGSSLQSHQSVITTTSESLQVRFNSAAQPSSKSGVEIRVRSLDYFGCPPGWVYLSGNCFGTGNSYASFVDAQKACNSMRSNLLQVPASYASNIRGFIKLLPSNMRTQYTWIGLTDKTSAGRYRHYWLNGDRQFWTSEISCISGSSFDTCYSNERCGTIFDRIFDYPYAIYMSGCTDIRMFACSMPPGGTDNFYRLPDEGDVTTTYRPIIIPRSYSDNTFWIWGVVVASIFVAGLAVVGICSGLRASQMRRRAAGATGIAVSVGRVTIPPPTGGYPVQYPQYPGPRMPAYSAAPPSYEAAVEGGYANPGYAT